MTKIEENKTDTDDGFPLNRRLVPYQRPTESVHIYESFDGTDYLFKKYEHVSNTSWFVKEISEVTVHLGEKLGSLDIQDMFTNVPMTTDIKR
jgi:hypothetical protein